MKRKIFTFLVLALICAMILPVGACTDPEQPGTGEPDTSQPQTSVDTPGDNTAEPETKEYIEPMYDGRKVSLQTVVETDYVYPAGFTLWFNNGYCRFEDEENLDDPGKWRVIDYEGNSLLPDDFRAASVSNYNKDGVAAVKDYMLESGKYVEIDPEGNVLREITGQDYSDFDDDNGENLYHPSDMGWYAEPTEFDENGEANNYSNFHYFDKDGNILFDGQVIDYISYFSNGIAVYEQDGKIGLVSDKGDILFPASLEGHSHPNSGPIISEDRVVAYRIEDNTDYMVIYEVVNE